MAAWAWPVEEWDVGSDLELSEEAEQGEVEVAVVEGACGDSQGGAAAEDYVDPFGDK